MYCVGDEGDAAMSAADAAEPRRGEWTVLLLVCAAHFVSHVHILVLPPLFPALKDAFQVGYVELGLALALFNVASALTQAPAGFLADRIGAQRLLIGGLLLAGFAVASIGIVGTYGWLLAASVLLGVANSVYHPADYAILAVGIDKARIGRAFSYHTFAGFLGAAVAPGALGLVAAAWGWRPALIAGGIIAPLAALPLLRVDLPGGAAPARADARRRGAGGARLVTPTVLQLTLFFMLLSLSSAGLQNFSVAAFTSGYGIDAGRANAALTAYLFATACGVLSGGFIADLTRRHAELAAAGFALNAAIVLLIGIADPGAAALVAAMAAAGFLSGLIMPSRDMLVREAAPPGASGRVFGIVSTGFNFGGMIAPLAFGWILDHGRPHWVFGATAAFMLLTVAMALVGDRRARPAPMKAGGAAP
jgi:MFS transporter, FSR family, fosmidomycin resistance protein